MQETASLLAIVEDIDCVLLPLQFGAQESSQGYVIVDDQNLAASCWSQGRAWAAGFTLAVNGGEDG